MSSLSTDTITSNIGDSVDAVRSTLGDLDVDIDFQSVAESVDSAVSSVADTAVELVDAAGNVTVAGGRVVSRTARHSVRLVRSHPRVAITSVALVAALVAAFVWFRTSDTTSSAEHDLKVAA